MEVVTEEELEAIRESVKEFIEIVDINNSESPTEDVPIVEKDSSDDSPGEYRVNEKTVPRPSRLVDNYKGIGIFDEPVQLLIDNGTFPEGQIVIEGTGGDSELPAFRVGRGDMERRRSHLKDRLRDVAGATMDYNQGIEFSEDTFKESMKAILRPWLISNPETTVIIPLFGIEELGEEIELEPPTAGELEYSIGGSRFEKDDSEDSLDESDIGIDVESAADIEIEDISISETTTSDLTAIRNIETRRDRPNEVEFPSHKISIQLNTLARQKISIDIANMVTTILRMSDPFSEFTSGESFTHTPHHYLLYDDGVPQLRKNLLSRRSFENDRVARTSATISSDDVEEIERKWSTLHEYLPSAIGDSKDVLSRPIQRFNQMYEKSRKEDAIIDCVIGLESTLIKDGGRVHERGTVLLEGDEEEPEFIYDYLGTLWELRNNIVHTDQEIPSCTVNGEDLPPEQVLRYARYFLSRIIQEYAELDKNHPDKNITQINQKVIGPKIANRLTMIGEDGS